MLVVIRIGGSVIASPINVKLIDQYTALLKKLSKSDHQIIAVVGGGSLARKFIEIAKQLDLNESRQDWLAIHVSRLYALLLSFKLKKDGNVPTSIKKALSILKSGKIVVMGGLEPGMTTDTVAASLAKEANAQLFVKASNQDGIFTKDPRKHQNAKKLNKVTYKELKKLFEQDTHKAGIHQIIDPVALKILQETEIRTVVLNGYNPVNIEHAINGKDVGTVITHSHD